jgi:hypothetical protein
MLHALYSWRPLGALLVEKGLLASSELESALAEQQRSGRLIGEILVESGMLSAFSLARALTEQHGVELQAAGDFGTGSAAGSSSRTPGAWRPLGKLLVEKGYLTKTELREALATQRESGGRRLLGEILVAEGFLSGISLARALAEQNGFELDPEACETAQTVLQTSAPGQVTYEVWEVGYEPRYQAQNVLYESASLLEAVDFAAEFVEDHDPDGVEIQRVDGKARETVWTYSESRADATAASRKGLAEIFGFDPTLWDGATAG